MFSAIYTGTLRHRRFLPKRHEFTYAMTLFYIDLDELPALFEVNRPEQSQCNSSWFNSIFSWSLNKKTLGSFRRSDYLGSADKDLAQAVREEVLHQVGTCPTGPIRMLTNLRMWGVCFNPVTFYYLFEQGAQRPAVILAQVNNTPWNERHCYVIPCDSENSKTKAMFDKQFHVSPFNPLDMQYRWVSSNPDQTLLVHMENVKDQSCVMDATLNLSRAPWSASALKKILWRYPWASIKIPAAIYWQALKLLVKRVPIYSHTRVTNEKV